jgi:putative glutathione S-transferase
MTATRFELGREAAPSGEFVRQASVFRDRVTADGSSGLPAAAGRYHLYVALACPWAHRTLLVRALKGLEDAISVSYVHPFRDARGWAFPGGRHVDDVNGFRFLAEAYARTDPGFQGRVSVPVLWDRERGRIVNNESGDLVRILGREFDAFARHPELDLYPEDLRAEIDAVNARVYEDVNNGVYRAGFAQTQDAYDAAFDRLFAALGWLEERLGTSRYLVGDRTTEADWRLWTTLVRFDAVYHTHFRCNGRLVADMPNLWGYARELFQVRGVAETVDLDEIKRHYYTTHDELNPKRIVPKGPFVDWREPHGRERLGAAGGTRDDNVDPGA